MERVAVALLGWVIDDREGRQESDLQGPEPWDFPIPKWNRDVRQCIES